MTIFLQHLQRLKLGLEQPQSGPKPRKAIAKVSEKKKQQVKDAVPAKQQLEAWFNDTRKKLTGTCQCGCGEKSQKKDDTFYKGSCCHIFPKKDFNSVRVHPLNYVERAMFGGCHSNMDNTSMDNWPSMADWDDIRAKVLVLEHYLTREEKATKFYTQLMKLVEANP